MRFLILILIFINIGVLTYLNQNYFFQVNGSATSEELAADQLTLLNDHQIEALKKSLPTSEDTVTNTTVNNEAKAATEAPETKTPEPKPKPVIEQKPVLACYRWDDLSESDFAQAQSLTSELGLKSLTNKTTQTKAQRYWVYMPPAANADEAQSTAAALKAQGIKDLYVLGGPEWKNAISFGVFSESRYADNRLKELTAKGITNIRMAPRGETQTISYRLTVLSASPADAEKLKAKDRRLKSTKLKSIRCP